MRYFPSIGVLACAVLLAIASLGCRSIRRGEPIQGPLDVSDAKIARGQQVFARNCAICHPGGEGGLGPALNNVVYPRWLMKVQVRTGLGVMPSFDKHTISAEDLDALVNYALANRRHDPNPVR